MFMRRVTRGAIAWALTLAATVPAAQEARGGWWHGLGQRLETTARVEIEWGLETVETESQKAEFLFQPQLKLDLYGDAELTLLPRLRGDAFDHLGSNDFDATQSSGAGGVATEVRELYLETSLGRSYLTLGKQQIVWGQADGLKVLDVVNPQDFREFILDDFSDSRLPLWSANLEVPVGGLTLQLLWIPDTTYHKLAEPGSSFEVVAPGLLPVLPEGIPVAMDPVLEPSRFLADSDFGLRLSTFFRGWDLTFNYLYHYHDLPVFSHQIETNDPGPLLTLTPHYERSHLMGGTFSNAFGDLTLRGEVGFASDRFFPTRSPGDTDGVAESDELSYVLGLDWYGFKETVLSFQIFQNHLTSGVSGVVRAPKETRLSLVVRRELRNDTLVAEAIWIHDLGPSDGLFRPKLSYELRDGVRGWAGIDLFYGSRSGLFGQYDDQDRVVFGMEWGL